MIKINTKKIIIILLLISVIFRFGFILIHENHDCTHDDNCPICAIINNYKKDISGSSPNVTALIIAIVFGFKLLKIYLDKLIYRKNKQTLVGLKVQLNN